MRNFIFPIILGMALLISSSCASSSAGITTSNIPLSGKNYRVVGNGQTQVDWWSLDLGLVGLPLEEPPIDRAVQELIDQHNGDALINLRYSTDRFIFLFMTRHRFTLKADVVKVQN
ncbi:MAG: hypothetical protein CMN77_20090 [Spirochaetaceae bacterium]|nr:hypothetical protein [Spirochaetaceae bacterium]|tara:strand:+ start:32250 stop:32597 length:348 start_codon:yes stop_codon:yes gene_type:complete